MFLVIVQQITIAFCIGNKYKFAHIVQETAAIDHKLV